MLLTLLVPRAQIFRVNVLLFTDYHGHTRKTIRAKEPEKSPKNRTFFEFFQVQLSKWVANAPFRATKHHKIAKKFSGPHEQVWT